MTFYVNLEGGRPAESAELNGMGRDWRQLLLADFLVGGDRLRCTRQKESTGWVYRCYGQQYEALFVPDNRRDDTIFVIGVFDGPRRTNRIVPEVVEVKGPWKDMLERPSARGRGGPTVTAHLEAAFEGFEARLGPARTPPKEARRARPLRWSHREEDSGEDALAQALRKAGISAKSRRRLLDAANKPQPAKAPAPAPAPVVSVERPAPRPPATVSVSGVASKPAVAVPVAAAANEPADNVPAAVPAAVAAPVATAPRVASPAVAASPTVAAGGASAVATGADAPGSPARRKTRIQPVQPEGSPESRTAEAAPRPLDPAAAARLHALLLGTLPGASAFADEVDPVAAVASRRVELEGRLAELRAELDALPDATALEALLARAEGLVQALHGAGLLDRVAADSSAARLDRLAAELARPGAAGLPSWLRSDPAYLDEDEALAELGAAIAWVEEAFPDGAPESLRELASPQGDAPTRAARLEAAWEAASTGALLAEGLQGLRVPAALEGLDADAIQRILDGLADLRERLTDTALEEAWDLLDELKPGSWLERIDPVRTLEGPVAAAVAHLPTWELVEGICSAEPRSPRRRNASPSPPAGAAPREEEAAGSAVVLGLSNPLGSLDGRDSEAPVIRVRLPEGANDLGRFLFPLRVEAPEPLEGPLVLELRAEHLKTMPAQQLQGGLEVVRPDGEDGFLRVRRTVERGEWRVVKRPTERVYHLDLAVPVVAYRASLQRWVDNKRPLELRVAADLGAGGLGEERFEFREVLETFPAIQIPQGDTTSVEEMVAAPLGVQSGYEELDPYVEKGGKTFYVAAPRRFGKTTLMNYLSEVAGRSAENQVFMVTLNRSQSPRRSMEVLVAALEEALETEYGSSVKMPLDERGWPTRKTFRRLREFLAEKGKRNVILFVDEAQSLVPRGDGGEWGTHLKNLVETDLAKGTKGRVAAMSVVLVGTTELPRRLGANCRNFMDVGAEGHSFDMGSLANFLSHLSQQTGDLVQSPVSARELLAGTANNLYTLRILLRELVKVMKREHRSFFLDSDIVRVVEEILESDANRSSSNLWQYVTAELSHTDKWEPIDAYPVAVAASTVAVDVTVEGKDALVAECVTWLETQLQATVQALVARERVRSGLEELERIGIVDAQWAFRRPLLEGVLQLRAHDGAFVDGADQVALMRLAVDHIQWQQGLVQRGEGGQARVYVEHHDSGLRAWRLTELPDPDARRRYLRTCAALRRLRDSHSKLPGDLHLPRVRAAGFNMDDPDQGVMIYDWIEGEPLQRMQEELPELSRAVVVEKVALALGALSQRGVVHRDVHPRNILVSIPGTRGSSRSPFEDTGPVDLESSDVLSASLIDFGLACLESSATNTSIGDRRYLAPELRDGGTAKAASDVYALGEVLRGPDPRGRPQSAALAALMDEMLARDPDERPDARQVAERLARIVREESHSDELEDASETVELLLMELRGCDPRVAAELADLEDALTLRLAGRLPFNLSLGLRAAEVLNRVFVVCVEHRDSPLMEGVRALPWKGHGYSLAGLSPALQGCTDKAVRDFGRQRDFQRVGLLRIAHQHPEARKEKLEAATRGVRGLSEEERVATVLVEAGRHLDAGLELEGHLRDLVVALTRGEAP